jgi:N-formylglutamate deformylase
MRARKVRPADPAGSRPPVADAVEEERVSDDGHGAGFEVVGPVGASYPVVVHVPHSSTIVPTAVRAEMLLDDAALAEELRRLTDHRTDVLAGHVGTVGAWRFVNRRSRLVVDPERLPDDREAMVARGMGAVYTRSSGQEPLRAPDAPRDARLIRTYFRPYADAFGKLVTELLDDHGSAVVVDLHSYPRRPLPYELHADAPRPEVCVGTDAFHTPAWLRQLVVESAEDAGWSVGLDVPFAGTYVPMNRFQRDGRVRSVMLEIRRDTYLDERTATPHAGEERMRRFVTQVVAAIIDQNASTVISSSAQSGV